MIKNLPSDTGDSGSAPGQRTEIPHAKGHLSPSPQLLRPSATASEKPSCLNERSRLLQLRPNAAKNNTYFLKKKRKPLDRRLMKRHSLRNELR